MAVYKGVTQASDLHDGISAITVALSNETHGFSLPATGFENISYTNAGSDITVYVGGTTAIYENVSSSGSLSADNRWGFSITSNTNITAGKDGSNPGITLSGLTGSTAQVVLSIFIRVASDDIRTVSRSLSYSTARQGSDGNVRGLRIGASRQSFRADGTNTLISDADNGTVVLTVNRTGLTGNILWQRSTNAAALTTIAGQTDEDFSVSAADFGSANSIRYVVSQDIVSYLINTTLATMVTSSSTSIVLADGTDFANSGTIRFADDEDTATYTGKSGNTLTGVTGISADHAISVEITCQGSPTTTTLADAVTLFRVRNGTDGSNGEDSFMAAILISAGNPAMRNNLGSVTYSAQLLKGSTAVATGASVGQISGYEWALNNTVLTIANIQDQTGSTTNTSSLGSGNYPESTLTLAAVGLALGTTGPGACFVEVDITTVD